MTRNTGRWVCWGTSMGLVLIWCMYVLLNASDHLGDLPNGSGTLFVLIVITLIQAGWVVGRPGADLADPVAVGRISAMLEQNGHHLHWLRQRLDPSTPSGTDAAVLSLEDAQMIRRLDQRFRPSEE